MNNYKDYILFLGRSYGKPLTRTEWDNLHKEISSADVLRTLNMRKWDEFLEQCGYETLPFSKEDMIRYGKALGLDISHVTKEQWDGLIALPHFQNEQIPNSEEILHQFGEWNKFQRVVKAKPSIRKKEERVAKNIEKLSLEGCTTNTIAKRIQMGENMIRDYLETVGLFSQEYVKEHFSSLDEITKNQIMNTKLYNGEDKKVIREIMLENVKRLNLQRLRYCGLPGVNFIDYVLFSQHGIIPEKSLAAESEKISGHVMFSLIKNWNYIKGGEVFRQLKLYQGTIEDALKKPKYAKMQFDVVNFDWLGGWAKDKQAALKNLFQYNHLADESIIFMSLNDSFMERARAANGRGYNLEHKGGDSHLQIAVKSLEVFAKKDYREVQELFRVPYRDTVEMLSAGYLIRKRIN